jgi:ferredoxin
MAYKINPKKCLKCGLCVTQCPENAIIVDNKVKESDGLVLYTTRIDIKKCTDCATCVSHEWWCPAKAIIKAK